MKQQAKFFQLFLIGSLCLCISCSSDDSRDQNQFPGQNSDGCIVTSLAQVQTGQSVQFRTCLDDASTYLWNFGDGQTSTQKFPSHVYQEAGTYTVLLTIDDNETPYELSITVNESAPISNNMHSGIISKDEVWKEGEHFITGGLIIHAKVTIEPGAIIRINPGIPIIFVESQDAKTGTNASVYAVGTPEKPIVFTSSQDNPSPGDWGEFSFGKHSLIETSVFEYCTFEYGGKSINGIGPRPMVSIVDQGRVSFNHCTFRYSEGYAIQLDEKSTFEKFSNNTVADNGSYDINISGNSAGSIEDNNNIEGKGILISIHRITETVNWSGQNSPYVLETDLLIGSSEPNTGGSLTLNEGVTLAFAEGIGLRTSDNDISLYVNGTAARPVIFTALNDDATSLWKGVELTGSLSEDSYFNYAIFEKAGSYSRFDTHNAVIYVNGTTLNMTNCKISGNKKYGIQFSSMAELGEFSNNDIGSTNEYAMGMRGNQAGGIDSGNTFSGGKDVELFSNDNIDKDITWPALGVFYRIMRTLYIGSQSGTFNTLTLSPGVKISGNIEVGKNYTTGEGIINAPGSLIAVGTESEPILFENGGLSTAEMISFEGQTQSNSILDHCIVDGKSLTSVGIRITFIENDQSNPYPTIRNSTIKNMTGYPIYVSDAYPIIENNSYEGNGTNDVYYIP
ncbi:PKD domain-containing protein [Aquimarina sp. U1-2]|uniref:PKD domain-containing protein n=1 Tax=Aquimarina sp. U1-2 TaxID=2823141 RepID=UPI001AECEED2|nr:PKD domain-containing protein [Aquimarina sp. U1-2]MBP2832204.1 PKD domain-containing protein [Aquimarina sp. U1-2]